MTDLIIKSSTGTGNNLLIQGADSSPAITIAETGTTTFAENATFSGAVTAATIDTGNGATEIYDMNQDIKTDDIPSFPRVTNTAAPCFYARGQTQNNFAVAGNSNIVLTTTDINTGGGYSTSTGIYTVPVAGRYYFTILLYMYSDDTQAWTMYKDSSIIAGYYANASHVVGTDFVSQLSHIETCAVGDEISVKNDFSSSRNLYAGSAAHTRFLGQFLG